MNNFAKNNSLRTLVLFSFCLVLSACAKIDLFEKVATVPKHEWQSSFKPQFKFTIADTTAPYQLFIIFRHTEKYHYNNIWVNLYTKTPGDSATAKVQYELPLATNEKGWLGNGMDDLYEHRIALTPFSGDFYFKKQGEYTFTIEHIMREDPLEAVMNVGLRVEKKQP